MYPADCKYTKDHEWIKVFELKDGKKKSKTRTFFPGYILVEAVQRELNRGGQVFLVHNRALTWRRLPGCRLPWPFALLPRTSPSMPGASRRSRRATPARPAW